MTCVLCTYFELNRKRSVGVHHARRTRLTRGTPITRRARFAWWTWLIRNRLTVGAEAHRALATGVAFRANGTIATLFAATTTTTISIAVATVARAALVTIVGGRVVTDVFNAGCVRHHGRSVFRSFECRS